MAIPPIPPIPPVASAEALACGLDGGLIDELGNVVGRDGAVLGRVRSDLPAMVGRPVSACGRVVDAKGQVAGYVCENLLPQPPSAARPLDRRLRVDDAGTIYDHEGVPVGRMTRSPASSRPPAAPSPSEVCLDVKSTHDGIQLIIRIPTVLHACPPPS